MSLDDYNPLTATYGPLNTINIATGTVFSAAFFNGCDMYATSSNQMFDLKFATNLPSSTEFTVKMTSGISTTV